MDLASDLSPQVSRGFFRARDFVAFFCLLHVLLGRFFGVLNPGWKPFKSSSWKTFLGRIRGVSEPYQGRIRAVSGPYEGRIKAVSGPYQGRIRAVSGPYQGRIRAVSAYPRAATGPILVRQRGSQWFSGLSDPKSLITAPNSAQNQRNLSGYKCTYNLAKIKKRQSSHRKACIPGI